MITANLPAAEAFHTGPALRLAASDPAIALADTEPAFTARVATLLGEHYPGCSTAFLDWITQRAWSTHRAARARLDLPHSALVLLRDLLAAAPDTDTSRLATAEVTAALNRLTPTTAAKGRRP